MLDQFSSAHPRILRKVLLHELSQVGSLCTLTCTHTHTRTHTHTHTHTHTPCMPMASTIAATPSLQGRLSAMIQLFSDKSHSQHHLLMLQSWNLFVRHLGQVSPLKTTETVTLRHTGMETFCRCHGYHSHNKHSL